MKLIWDIKNLNIIFITTGELKDIELYKKEEEESLKNSKEAVKFAKNELEKLFYHIKRKLKKSILKYLTYLKNKYNTCVIKKRIKEL